MLGRKVVERSHINNRKKERKRDVIDYQRNREKVNKTFIVREAKKEEKKVLVGSFQG